MAMANWLPDDHSYRGLVRAWVLSDLVPLLPKAFAQTALHLALTEIAASGDPHAACHLTKRVSLELAESLWPHDSYSSIPPELRSGLSPDMLTQYGDGFGPGQVLAAAVDGARNGRPPFLETSPFHGDAGPTVRGKSFVAAARWLPPELVADILARVLVTDGTEEPRALTHRAKLMPDLHYDGLLSVLPAEYAASVAQFLRDSLDGMERAVCLLQLLPLLTGKEREECANAAFENPADLSTSGLNLVKLDAVCPAVVKAGYVDRVLTAIETGALPDHYWWLGLMAPEFSRAETEHALSAVRPDAEHPVRRPPRRWVLARLASFGPEEAARALDLLYDQAERAGLAPSLIWSLKRYVPDVSFELNGEAGYRRPWWEECTYPGVARHWNSGVWRYPGRPGDLHRCGGDVQSNTLLDTLYELAGNCSADQVPDLLDLANEQDDPWVALTVLAASTHMTEGADRDVVMAEILGRLRTRREQALTRSPVYRAKVDGFPEDSPWLVRGIGDWTPFFVRLLSSAVAPAVKPLLFEGGYLDGVSRTHHAFGDSHERLDDWAHDVLTLTPILSVDELDALLALRRGGTVEILSESTRKAFEAGIATAFAACGEEARAYELVRGLSWQTQLIRSSAMADIVTQIPAEGLSEWMAKVHENFDGPVDRGGLWNVFWDRWPELSKEQLWQSLDRWTTELPHDSRGGVIADILHYRFAVAELASRSELLRLLDLLEL
jgi:hypothetical protein